MKIINIYKIIKKEINFNIDNYWIFLSAFIILSTNIIIIYFGETISGDYSQTDTRSLTLSIIHLQMYLIPVLSFILSYDAILSEKEAGTLDLILSYKISILDIFIGKLLGNRLIFMFAFLLGFIPISIYLVLIGIKIITLIKFILTSIWLSIIFNGLALYISNLSKDRTMVILLSISIWMYFVFIYDMLFIFLVTVLYSKISINILNIILMFNPTEIFRIISIIYFMSNDANELFGINIGFTKTFYILFFMLSWILTIIYGFILISSSNKKYE